MIKVTTARLVLHQLKITNEGYHNNTHGTGHLTDCPKAICAKNRKLIEQAEQEMRKK